MHLTDRQRREKEFWDQHASVDMYSNWREQSYETWRTYRPIQRAALDWLGPVAGRKVLLCGVGAQAVIFARAGAEVSGFDISETQIRAVESLARRMNVADRITVAPMPFEALQYPDSYFDIAYGHAILHHIDLAKGAAELNRVLKPGGRATFIEPLGVNPVLQFARQHLPYPGKGRTEDERPLVYRDIEFFAKHFAHAEYREFNLLAMVRRRVTRNRSILGLLEQSDKVLLERLPALRRFCQQVWIGVQTAASKPNSAG